MFAKKVLKATFNDLRMSKCTPCPDCSVSIAENVEAVGKSGDEKRMYDAAVGLFHGTVFSEAADKIRLDECFAAGDRAFSEQQIGDTPAEALHLIRYRGEFPRFSASWFDIRFYDENGIWIVKNFLTDFRWCIELLTLFKDIYITPDAESPADNGLVPPVLAGSYSCGKSHVCHRIDTGR